MTPLVAASHGVEEFRNFWVERGQPTVVQNKHK